MGVKENYNFVIVGAGILGLSMAKNLRGRYPESSILVLEKERALGAHASGRNSGVLHSGIYYEERSLKARLCSGGARMMREYCEEHGLDLHRTGKVILPVKDGDDELLYMLERRGAANGAVVEVIDEPQLKTIEPSARTHTGKALYAPETSVVDPAQILRHLSAGIVADGVRVELGSRLDSYDRRSSTVGAGGRRIGFGTLINVAGQSADAVARMMGAGRRYGSLPIKGEYYRLAECPGVTVNGLIYPVPDMNVPFLGVHFTRAIDGTVYVGPSAVPVLGRENYRGLQGIRPGTAMAILYSLALQYVRNRNGFRRYANEEATRILKSRFAAAARKLIPALDAHCLHKSRKVGIRSQLFDRVEKTMVMDFLVESQGNTIHVLNAASPGFTSSFSFADYVAEHYIA